MASSPPTRRTSSPVIPAPISFSAISNATQLFINRPHPADRPQGSRWVNTDLPPVRAPLIRYPDGRSPLTNLPQTDITAVTRRDES